MIKKMILFQDSHENIIKFVKNKFNSNSSDPELLIQKIMGTR